MTRIEEIIHENQQLLNDSKLPNGELWTLLVENCMKQACREVLVKAAENATTEYNFYTRHSWTVNKQSILQTEL
jgi:hypothetical protein